MLLIGSYAFASSIWIVFEGIRFTMFYLAKAEAGSWNVSKNNLRGYHQWHTSRNCGAQGKCWTSVASAVAEVESTYLDSRIVVRGVSSLDHG